MPCIKHSTILIDGITSPGKSLDSCYSCLIADVADRVSDLEATIKRQNNTISGLLDLLYVETGSPDGPTSLQGRLVAIEEMLKGKL